jgi:hypothetical protein
MIALLQPRRNSTCGNPPNFGYPLRRSNRRNPCRSTVPYRAWQRVSCSIAPGKRVERLRKQPGGEEWARDLQSLFEPHPRGR